MNKIITTVLALGFLTITIAAQEIITLQSTASPDHIEWKNEEQEQKLPHDNSEIVANVSSPSLTVYRPENGRGNGTALIIAPGGGFHFLSISNEGTKVAEWCTQNGITAFVLRYRLVPTNGNPMMEFLQKVQSDQEKMDQEMGPIIELSIDDGLAAIEYVRNHAEEYGINKNQIGIVGFSAGGTVAGGAAFEYTSEANRPDFSAPIYPALHVVDTDTMPEKPMPLFMAVTSDDVFGFQTQCTALYDQWNKAGQPVELHIYEEGGHGFGMKDQNKLSDQWIDAFGAWMTTHGWMGK